MKAPQGMDTRPTTDRIKETLFNMLQPYLAGAVFVDLFSGSGAIGIEALSRGAKRAYFVETGAKALECIRQNLEFTKLAQRAVVLRQDAAAALDTLPEKTVDVVFLDPPYRAGQERRVLEALAAAPCVTDETLIVVESALDTDFSFLGEISLSLEREKRYKTNRHLFLRRGCPAGEQESF